MCSGKSTCSVLVVITAIFAGYLVNHLIKFGLFSTIHAEQEHGNKNCEILTNKNKKLIGCEDIAEFEDGSVVLSCQDRSILTQELLTPKPMSQICQELSYKHPGYLFSMKSIHSPIDDTEEFAEIKLLDRVSPDFAPHGIGLITDKYKTKWIYLVNHRRDGDVVEIYELDKDNKYATLKQEVHSPLFLGINDIAPVVIDANTNTIGFYVTNSLAWPLKTKLNMMETLLALEQCDLIYCEPDTFEYVDRYSEDDTNTFQSQWKCVIAATHLGYGNGVDISMDGALVYVAETMAKRVRIYDRNETDGALTKRSTISASSAVDNFYLDRETGDLYIGSHPNILQFFRHVLNTSVITPSQVLHWNKKTGDLKEIYLSNGHSRNHVSGSSVGVYDTKTKTLLIGTVTTATMRCKL